MSSLPSSIEQALSCSSRGQERDRRLLEGQTFFHEEGQPEQQGGPSRSAASQQVSSTHAARSDRGADQGFHNS